MKTGSQSGAQSCVKQNLSSADDDILVITVASVIVNTFDVTTTAVSSIKAAISRYALVFHSTRQQTMKFHIGKRGEKYSVSIFPRYGVRKYREIQAKLSNERMKYFRLKGRNKGIF